MHVRTRLASLAPALLAALAAGASADDTKAPQPPAAGDPPPVVSAPKTDAPKTNAPKTDAPRAATAAAKAPDAKAPVSAAAVPTQAGPRTLDEALRRLAQRRADVDFRDMALDQVVDFLSKVGRVNMMVSAAFQAKAQGALPVVTLKLSDVSLKQCAELVAKTTGAQLAFRDGVLQFTTPEDARGAPVLRIYSISDLTFRVRNFPGPDLQLHLGDAKYVQEEETEQESPLDNPQEVVDMIRKFTGEGTWDDAEVSISADGNKLVVRQYPEVLREISRLLLVLRAAK